MSNYSYPLASFVGLTAVYPDLTTLTSEVATSTIASTLDDINLESDTYTFSFLVALTALEQTTLNGLVAAHTGVPPLADTVSEGKVAQLAAPSVTDDSSLGFSLGDRWYTVGGSEYVCVDPSAGSAVWKKTTVPEPSFGNERFYVATDKPLSHTSSSYKEAISLSSSLSGGVYRVEWYYEWALDSVSYDFRAEVRLDSTVVGNQRQEPKDSSGSKEDYKETGSGTDQRHPVQGFWEGTLSSGAHTASIYFSSSRDKIAATVYRCRLLIIRVG